jgi:predicted phage terminase large subunit-like protein
LPRKKKITNEITEQQLLESLATLTQTQLLAELYKQSFYEFFIAAFNEVLEPDTELVITPVIKELCDVLQHEAERIADNKPRKQHLLINLPPRLLKSKIITVCYNAWVWIKFPYFKFITASITSDLSDELSKECRTLIESDWYKELFPNTILKSDQNQKSHYDTTAGGKRKAVTRSSASIGFGSHIFILDDIQHSNDQYSPTTREAAIKFYEGLVKSRLNNKKTGLIICVTQRLFVGDITDYILDTYGDSFKHISVPIELTPQSVVKPEHFKKYYNEDGLLLPELYDRDVINDLKKNSGVYNAQYLQKPINSDNSMFKADDFGRISHQEFSRKYYDDNGKQKEPFTWHFFLDTAFSDKKSSDASALLVAAKIGGQIFIKDVRGVRMNFPDLIKYIKEYVISNGWSPQSKVYIESAASGISLIQQLNIETGLTVFPLKHNGESKMIRANSVTNYISAGKVVLIEGSYTTHFLEEVSAFPFAANDDMTDAMVYAIRTLAVTNSSMSYFFT